MGCKIISLSWEQQEKVFDFLGTYYVQGTLIGTFHNSLSFFKLLYEAYIIKPVLLMRKLKLRWVKLLSQCDMLLNEESESEFTSYFIPKPCP